MEFNEKLQELRKNKGLTQEELAEALYVSRTAVSKWEMGRGYPNIDSLKAIAKLFSVTIDELLSGDELLTIASEDNKQKEKRVRDLVYGLLDFSIISLFFLPFFGERTSEGIRAVSLLFLSGVSLYLRITYIVFVALMALFGILTLALQNFNQTFWVQNKDKISLILNIVGALIFTISSQPYAAVFLSIFLAVKVLLIIKRQ
jgi:transcriptional regulator with XRE-family HTH domain